MNRPPRPCHDFSHFKFAAHPDDEPFKEEDRTLKTSIQTKILKRGEDYRLEPTIDTIRVGLSWNNASGIDASVAIFDGERNCLDKVYYDKEESQGRAVRRCTKRKTKGRSGDDEVIHVELSDLPLVVHHLVFVITVYSRQSSSSQVKNAYVRMMYGNDPSKGDELCRFSLAKLPGTAVLMGQLTRKRAYWYFKALGTPTNGRNIRQILQNREIKDCVFSYPSAAPLIRRVYATVLKGRNLAGKKSHLRFWKTRTSDPYYVIHYKGKEDRECKPERKTLDPTWEARCFDMDCIVETENKVLEISVFDRDRITPDTFMGSIHVRGSQLFRLGSGIHTYWFTLKESEEKKHMHEHVSGDILVKFNIEEPVQVRERAFHHSFGRGCGSFTSKSNSHGRHPSYPV